MPPHDLSVIIVSNNHCRYLDRCLTSLCEQAPFEVFLVDNASVDGTAEYVRTHFSQVHLLAETVKRGFAANSNLAIRRSQGRYILLLNPDTEVTPGALNRLVAYMDANPEVGVCGPQLRFPDGNLQLSCRAFPTWRSVIARRTPLRTFLRNGSTNRHHLLEHIDHSQTQEIDWLLGACLCIRRETLDDVGLLDEHYFLYVEDIDYCLRAHHRGWRVCYMPEAVVIHHHLAVSDKYFFNKLTYYHFLSMIYYFFSHNLPPLLRPLGGFIVRWLVPQTAACDNIR